MGEVEPTTAGTSSELPARIHRDPEDDFFCLRFQVWYPSFDCAIRTRYRTCPSCLGCEQGLFNLQRHRTAIQRLRFFPPDGG
jgi:hypothetical protein